MGWISRMHLCDVRHIKNWTSSHVQNLNERITIGFNTYSRFQKGEPSAADTLGLYYCGENKWRE